MIRNMKALGLAVVAVLALGAVAASPASAVDIFTTDAVGGTTTVSGTSNDNVFELTGTGDGFQCETSSFSATVNNNDEEITVSPSYTGTFEGEEPHEHCTAIGVASTATVVMNGCAYILTGETTGEDEGKTDATVWIECPGSNEIEIKTNVGCTIKVPPQTPTSGGVTYTKDTPNAGEVTVDATATGVTYTSSGFTCGLGGIPSEANDADYTGSVPVQGASGNIEVSS